VTADALEAQLESVGERVRGAVRAEVVGLVASEELRARMLEYPGRGGKALRPALLLAACAAFDGDDRRALPAAVAIELMHTAFLVHDDIEDDAAVRRSGPSLHRMVGTPLAVHTGDALALASFTPLLGRRGLGDQLRERVLEELVAMARLTLEGQDLELRWRGTSDGTTDLDDADYFHLVGLKTASYTTVFPLRIGALIGSHGAADLTALTRFGYVLGIAFQLRDDILDLCIDDEGAGSEDLLEAKRTLMLLHTVRLADDPDRRWLESYLAMPLGERRAEDALRLFGLMRRYGAIDHAQQAIADLAARALDAFDDAFRVLSPSPSAAFIRQLVPFMTDRRW
jgi:geranylgeranyl diphosphate synthase type II